MIGQKRLRDEVCRTKFKMRKLEFDTCPNQTRINFRLKILPKKKQKKKQKIEKKKKPKKLTLLYKKVETTVETKKDRDESRKKFKIPSDEKLKIWDTWKENTNSASVNLHESPQSTNWLKT
jgi:hypothetical protein